MQIQPTEPKLPKPTDLNSMIILEIGTESPFKPIDIQPSDKLEDLGLNSMDLAVLEIGLELLLEKTSLRKVRLPITLKGSDTVQAVLDYVNGFATENKLYADD